MEELPIRPRGIRFQADFITPAHEAELLRIFQNELTWPTPKKPGTRLSLHYGYTFDYKTFGVDPEIPYKPFPEWLWPLIPRLPPREGGAGDVQSGGGEKGNVREIGGKRDEKGRRLPDQVCLQYYPPGAGIPPHVDTHSAYDELYALSLGSAAVMQFRRRRASTPSDDPSYTAEREEEPQTDTEVVDLDLPPRSLMQMSGESRLHWEHGIKKRKRDVLPGGGVRPRGDRWSITYRWLRPGAECECGDVRLCDTAQRRAGVEREFRWKEKEQLGKREETGEWKGEGEEKRETEGKDDGAESGSDGLEHTRTGNGNIGMTPS